MAQLPADRTKLAQAQSNMSPSLTASSQKTKEALTEAYDTIDLLNQKADNHAAATTLPHADKSVTRAKLADKVVGAGQLDDAAVGQSHHQDNGIPSRALPDNVILQRHMSDNSVGSAEIQAGAVQNQHLATGSVTADKIPGTLITDIGITAEFDKRGVNVERFGAKGDWNGTTGTDDTAAIQAACSNGGVVFFNSKFKITSRILIDKPTVLVFTPSAKIVQTQFEFPCFEVKSKDVKFCGEMHFENLGTPYHIQTRVPGVPPEFEGSPNVYSAGIVCNGNIDNFFSDRLYSKNFVVGLTLTNSTTSDASFSKNVVINYVDATDCWCGFLGGGVLDMVVDTIVGRNMVRSQGPNNEHVVYIGVRDAAKDHAIFFKNVIGIDCIGGGAVFQARSVKELHVENVIVTNCVNAFSLGSVDNAKVNSIRGFINDGVAGTVLQDHAIYLFASARASIKSVDISTSRQHQASLPSLSLIGIADGAYCYIDNLNVEATHATNPMRIARSTTVLEINNAYINYKTIAPAAGVYPFSNFEAELSILSAPTMKGTEKVLEIVNNNAAAKHYIKLAPNKIAGVKTASTVFASDNKFNIDFEGVDNNPPRIAAGQNFINFRGMNTVKLTTGGIAMIKMNYGSENQIYYVLCDDDGNGPSIVHNDAAGNIILKSGTNYAVNSWKVLMFMSRGTKFYEI